MDVTAIASLATDMSQTQTDTAVQLTVLKKAMNIQAEGAMQLVMAAVQVSQAINPPNLGNAIDTLA